MTGHAQRAGDAGLEPEPEAAARLFGADIDRARRFVDALARHGEERGLIGPQELPRLWTRHILNSAVIAPLFYGRVGDVGSGAGLPGLVLALMRPDVRWVLIEPMERRVAWLREQASDLQVENVEVVRARAEDCKGMGLDVVTARAVSALRTLIPLAVPLVRGGGELALLKGASVDGEVAAAHRQVQRFKLTDVRVERFGEGIVDVPSRVVRAVVPATAHGREF